MIESTKFNKMLHILKKSSDDLNINICIIDYDISQECDYEVITLHLKETNTQNGASVYKDLIIRSQLYYDENDDRYYSALDGDIINKEKALAEINILTNIDKNTFDKAENDTVSLKINLLDTETQEPIKNQIVYLYINGTPDISILSAKTNRYGEANFDLYLPNFNITSGEHILYFEYKGNKTYRKTTSNYIFINLEDLKNKYIESNVTAYIEADESLILTYESRFNGTSWVNGFKEYSDLDVDDSDLIEGEVSFYIVKDNVRTFLGGGLLDNTMHSTYSSILTTFPKIYYNQNINIEAVFEGNNYFSQNIATTPIIFNRVNPTNIELKVVDFNDNDINIINNDGFKTKLSFEINNITLDSNLYESKLDNLYKLFKQVMGESFDIDDFSSNLELNDSELSNSELDNLYRLFRQVMKESFDIDNFSSADSDLYESGLNDLYKLFGQVTFYLQNINGEWGTLGANLPFHISNNLTLTNNGNSYTISTETDLLGIALNNYGLEENDPLYIKAEYSGNAIINDFTIDNKSQTPRGKLER